MNRRLAVPIILLLLFLCAGTVWALLGPLHLGQKLTPGKQITADGLRPQDTPAPDTTQESKRAEANPVPAGNPDFDVVRIDPKGTSVFAGRTEPGAQVTINGDGKKLGTARADENGEWTFTVEEKFASDDPKLALEVKPAAEVKREAALAAAAPPSADAASGPNSPGTSPQSGTPAADAGSPHTASAVTAHLLKDLQGMVNEARSGNAQEQAGKPPAAPSAASPSPAAPDAIQAPATPETAPAATPAAPAPGPQVAGIKTVPEPPMLEPKSNRANSVTATKLPPPAPGETTVRKSIPVPITFVFNEAQFTSDGRKAAELLLEYLKLKGFKQVALTGHADERGSDELNMNLSRDRLETVAGFLKQGGFSGDLQLEPKGKSEPYMGVVRSEFSQEELWQLDRRVELVVKP